MRTKTRRDDIPEQRDYAALASDLTSASHLEAGCATDAVVASIVECTRHLDELRQRTLDGSILSEERRLIPTLASSIRRGIETLGLDKRKAKTLEAL